MKIQVIGAIQVILVLLAVGVAIYVYPLLPDVVASHWDAAGHVNGYLPKLVSLIICPLFMALIFAIWLVIPHLEPLKDNMASFRLWFDGLMMFLQLFFFYVSILTILYNVGAELNIGQCILPALALLFGYIGLLLPRTKRNWYVGVKTPWTLSSDEIWDKTHALAGRLFLASAFLILIGSCLPEHAMWLVLMPILLTAVLSVGYSYWLYTCQSVDHSNT